MSMGGGSSGTTRSTTTNTPDPTVQRLNTLMADQIQGGINATGGIPSFVQQNPFAQPSAAELPFLQQFQQMANGPYFNPAEQMGIQSLQDAGNPALQFGNAQQYLNMIAGPQLQQSAVASGYGANSGAYLNSLANAGAGMALPIAQQSMQAQLQGGLGLMGFGPAAEQQYINRLQTGLSAAGAPRQAAYQESLRPQALVTGLLGGIPIGGGGTSLQVGSGQAPGFGWRDAMGLAGTAASVYAASGCWIADALYPPEDAMLARFYINVVWQGWVADATRALYQRIGQRVANSPSLRALVKPLFDIAVRRGRRCLGG